ncbi:hypothetical protein H4Q26_013718 [Puccinia striiformis f. sp. tritici PST-130]|nr:hypothetical protein H4Q26_013718 [Puccinia striiformis f. sp. tritici PST-130]
MAYPGFEALPRGDGPQKYWCIICDGRRTCLTSSMDSHKNSARHRTKLAQLNAFYQMTAGGPRGSTNKNRPGQQSPPGGPPSDIDMRMITYHLNKMMKFNLKMMMLKELTQANFDTATMNLSWKVMEGWTREIGLGVKKSLNLMNTIYPPQEAPQDLKGLVGFLQLHPDTLFPVWMSSNPRAVAHHHVSQHVQPSTNNFNHAPGESASLGHP